MIAKRIATALATGTAAGVVLLAAPAAQAAPTPTTAATCHHPEPRWQTTPPQTWTPTRHARGTAYPHGRVVSHHSINIRSGPGTGYRVIGHLRRGTLEHISYKTRGTSVLGNSRWYKLADHRGYVSARYVHVRNLNAVPWR
ncbi:SH3 domain-containing protein [Actinacidiphila soli]|uniref:SH3 domain-containing protein n=1 Tax=Actinacidiphila soli TaxID=2487275 RepID=UPI000FCAFF99|nr:SH3 domain-containing protein [Actinacidiphila soli]